MASVGKQVLDNLYVHLSALDALDDTDLVQKVRAAESSLPADLSRRPNVCKVHLRTRRVSLLAYSDFDSVPFPELAASWTFGESPTEPPVFRTYSETLNPPILHRKELLVTAGYPGREEWVAVTADAESLGLFDDTAAIGFRINWDRAVASKGYCIVGGRFQPLGNDITEDAVTLAEPLRGAVDRHLTALSRSGLSAPVQLAIRYGLLPPGSSFFDYGCGRGGDIEALRIAGFDANGWDPHYAPDSRLTEADAVNLGFVINVIEDPAERIEAVARAFRLARRVLTVGVMLYAGDIPGRPFRDGYLTSRNTFQKYFTQSELKDFLEHVLHQEVFLVGPGIALAFADRAWEQRFGAERFRARGVATRLLATEARRVRQARNSRNPAPTQRLVSRSAERLAEFRPILDQLWEATLELGRMHDPMEVTNLDEINGRIGSLKKAQRLLGQHYDQSLLATAARTRSDDIRLYMALQLFQRRSAYKQLDPQLQRDIKSFFGSHRDAQGAGMALLTDAAETPKLLEACKLAASQGLGWLDNDHSLQLHVSMLDRLPVVLRAYSACALTLWGSIADAQLVKIHINSGKLTLLEYDDFDSSPLPLLRRRVKINVRRQEYDLFEYGSPQYPKPLLYFKSRFLPEDYPGYAIQHAFDESLEASGAVTDSMPGPAPSELDAALDERRLAVRGMALCRSDKIPPLDQKCGRYLTYRSFVECGETQARIALPNLPVEFESYNALYDLATKILDPVIEYFGGIRLTYGFCSPELAKHINRNIAPDLDQHAAHERSRRGVHRCSRLGAAVDFLVVDESMWEVAQWISTNLPYDRLYFYGDDRPLHVSYGPDHKREFVEMRTTTAGRRVPRVRKPHPGTY